MLQLLLNQTFGKLNNEQEAIVKQILTSCNYTFDMVLTLLSVYRCEFCTLNPAFSKFNLNDIIYEQCSEFNYLAEEKQKKIAFDLQDNLEVVADKFQIKRVVSNLLSNAINYGTEKTEIVIITRQTPLEVEFLVRSKGRYIPDSEIHKLFNKYSSKGNKYNKTSTGLGLYLSKRIILAHKGKMIAESTLKGDNTFGFILPCLKDKISSINQYDNVNIS